MTSKELYETIQFSLRNYVMSNRTLVFVVTATAVILGGIACMGFTSHTRIKVDAVSELEDQVEHALMNGEKWRAMAEECKVVAELAVSTGEGWQAIAELNDKKLSEAVELQIEINDGVSAQTPFQFAQDSTQDAQNIEFTIDGQLVYLVGPGAQSVLEVLE